MTIPTIALYPPPELIAAQNGKATQPPDLQTDDSLKSYLTARRRVLLSEVAEIERILGIRQAEKKR